MGVVGYGIWILSVGVRIEMQELRSARIEMHEFGEVVCVIV